MVTLAHPIFRLVDQARQGCLITKHLLRGRLAAVHQRFGNHLINVTAGVLGETAFITQCLVLGFQNLGKCGRRPMDFLAPPKQIRVNPITASVRISIEIIHVQIGCCYAQLIKHTCALLRIRHTA